MAAAPSGTAKSRRRSGSSTPVTVQQGYSSEEVARRAYERFRARGEEHGRDQEDWFEAERELTGNRERTTR